MPTIEAEQVFRSVHRQTGGSDYPSRGITGLKLEMGNNKDVLVGPPFLELSLKGLLFALTLTSSIQASWMVDSIFPWPQVHLNWPVNLYSVALFVLGIAIYKSLVWALPLATLLVYLEAILPIQRASTFLSKVLRVLKMSSGYEKELMPYIAVVLPQFSFMVENVDYVEPVFPQMVKYMHIFGPHLSTVLPNLGKMGPFLAQMMPLMPQMEPYMANFMPHLVAVLPHFPIMILHMEDFLPYFDKIVPNLGGEILGVAKRRAEKYIYIYIDKICI